jgi:gluconate 2-dehydrogenase gamma chain
MVSTCDDATFAWLVCSRSISEGPHRRELLGSAALLFIGGATGARAQWLPWRPEAGSPPRPFVQGQWVFFDPAEGAAVEALVDRLIPPDPDTLGGKDAGCAVFIDRQLAGPYGGRAGLYLSPPFIKGIPQQGSQDPDGPAVRYRKALAALDANCKQEKSGAFASLSDASSKARAALRPPASQPARVCRSSDGS